MQKAEPDKYDMLKIIITHDFYKNEWSVKLTKLDNNINDDIYVVDYEIFWRLYYKLFCMKKRTTCVIRVYKKMSAMYEEILAIKFNMDKNNNICKMKFHSYTYLISYADEHQVENYTLKQVFLIRKLFDEDYPSPYLLFHKKDHSLLS